MEGYMRISQNEYRHLVTQEERLNILLDALFESATLLNKDALYFNNGDVDTVAKLIGGYRYYDKLTKLKEAESIKSDKEQWQKMMEEEDGNI